MLPNTEQYVNDSQARRFLLEYMGKLTNGMNINECVHLDPDISLLIVCLLWLADRNI